MMIVHLVGCGHCVGIGDDTFLVVVRLVLLQSSHVSNDRALDIAKCMLFDFIDAYLRLRLDTCLRNWISSI